jgi:UDP-N-acetylglucosamine 2-epimerase (non-hydrolysing)/GDP/UDP-N,N'-diacetylbacillosamine 2-epimerase (hydrolysing)
VAELVIGNSSSGIIEAPALAVPTVNIGTRQKGRLFAPSIVTCGETTEAIVAAIDVALAKPKAALRRREGLPYGAGGAAERIVEHLKSIDVKALRRKRFFDIDPKTLARSGGQPAPTGS